MTVDTSAAARTPGMARRLLTVQVAEDNLGISRAGGFLALFALVSAVLRLVWLYTPLTPDESGFLQVAEHWQRGGGSLYGPYFVDRPPLLLELFRLGGLAGGIPAVRLLGAAAAAVTVFCVGLTVRHLAGEVAARWAALTAAALTVSPMLGTSIPNGELLAAPFVAGGVLAGAALFRAESPGRRVRAGLAVGACGMAAVLVKQNMIDVGVFVVAGAVLLAFRRRLRPSDAVASALSILAGAVALCVPVLGYAAWQGSSLSGVFYAMYPFRLDAMAVMAHASQADRSTRLSAVALSGLLSGAPVVLALLAFALGARALRPVTPPVLAAVVGVLCVGAYDVVSIAAGGSYWLHYLVQLIVPASIAVGLLVVSAWRRTIRALTAVMMAVALVSWGSTLFTRIPADGQVIGTAVKRVSQPGDTVVSLYGDADVVQASGLHSPYPYLWSLPAHTLDPHGSTLDLLLSGPSAPTWVVVRGSQTQAFLDRVGAGAVLGHRYHLASEVCGRSIYLRDDESRSVPVPPSTTSVQYHGCHLPAVPLLHHVPGTT